MLVSYYQSITNTKSQEQQDLLAVLNNIKSGVYEDYVHPVRTAKTDEEKKKAKLNAPCITTSGVFSQRGNNYLKKHSGFIAIDFDHLQDIGDAFNLLMNDEYTFALFTSISGNGLCCIVKIDGKKHLEAFQALDKYYFTNYSLEADRACKDVSRPRYLSFDPHLFINEDSKLFKSYLPKPTRQEVKRFEQFNQGDHYEQKFERILAKINTDITQSYEDWVKIGFAIAAEYGERGLDYFKHISQFHPDYDAYKTEKKYRSLLGDRDSGVKIGTFYYICQQNGIDISDPVEESNRKMARKLKAAGKTEKEALKEIPNAIPEVIKEEFSKKLPASREFDLAAFEIWLRSNYDVKKNEVTRFYELNGQQLEQSNINTIYIDAKKIFPKVSREILESVLFSDYTTKHNPIKEYLNSLDWDGKDHISDLADCITSSTGDIYYRRYGLRQWLLGMIESVMDGKPNVLCLILAGKQNTGKSTFFTRLLPGPLKTYFAASQLDRGKDDEILMCQALVIFDDEFSGKSKQDAKQMKRLLSAHNFTLREPYGRNNVTLRRLATLCGTCNELDVLNDPTGNRRFIVFEIIDTFNYELYNKVDKSQVFAQCMHLYNQGNTSDLDSNFLQILQENSEQFVEVSIEEEMLRKFFAPSDYGVYFSASEIKDYIEEMTNQKLSIKRLGVCLRANYERVKHNGRYCYRVTTLG
jgi:predicted P-loop ATPase